MSFLNVVLPLGSSVLSFVFAALVLDQWWQRRHSFQLVWAIGLMCYGLSTGAEFQEGTTELDDFIIARVAPGAVTLERPMPVPGEERTLGQVPVPAPAAELLRPGDILTAEVARMPPNCGMYSVSKGRMSRSD